MATDAQDVALKPRAGRALLLGRQTDSPGGVVIFLQVVSEHLSPGWEVEWFVIGRRPRVRSRLVAVLQPVRDAWRLFRRLRGDSYDVIHVNPTFGLRSMLRDGLFMLALRGAGCRNVLVLFHGWDMELARSVQQAPLLRWLVRISFGTAAHILVLAPQFKRQLVAMGIDGERIGVTTTMFDGRLFDGIPADERNPGRARILFLSRMAPDKGADVLILAFEQVRQVFPAVELVLAGEGPVRGELLRHSGEERLREQGITLPGFVNGERKARLLLGATVFVLPSRHAEGCPVAVLEAMAAGLPVVATRVGAVPMLIRDGVNGILLDEATPERLADALSRLLADAGLRSRMAERNRAQAWERYEASRVTAQLEAQYAEISGRGNGR